MTEDCIFCAIAAGVIPVELVYEDENFVAFHDQNAQAPVHLLLVPRRHVADLMAFVDPGVQAGAFAAIQELTRRVGICSEGFRVVVNCGDNGGQTVYHLHFHILGGRFLQWPPG